MGFYQRPYSEEQPEAPVGFKKMTFVWNNQHYHAELSTATHVYTFVVFDNKHLHNVKRSVVNGERWTHGHYGDAVLEQWPELNSAVAWFQTHLNAIKEFRIRGCEFDLAQFEGYAESMRLIIKGLKGETFDAATTETVFPELGSD